MSANFSLSLRILLAAAAIALTLGAAGCKNNNQPAATDQSQNQAAPADQSQNGAANSNLAPTQQTSSNSNYQQAPQDQGYADNQNVGEEDTSYGQPEMEAQQAPPPLPEYDQPECPGEGYIWTPGYWSYASQGYYWVPGAWTQPPESGYLWTPGYWGFVARHYRFHHGFWGRHVGYYGGINYGFGYTGTGYQGGYWNGDRFNYNRSVNNVNVTNIHNVYNTTVIVNNNNRVSYNGPGGVTRQPMPAEVVALHEQRIPPMTTQLQNQQSAAQNRQQFAAVNHGRPAVVAAPKPIMAGKPIAPVLPARPAASTRSAPNAQPNRP